MAGFKVRLPGLAVSRKGSLVTDPAHNPVVDCFQRTPTKTPVYEHTVQENHDHENLISVRILIMVTELNFSSSTKTQFL